MFARNYGPVSTLPTPVYFYGMTVGQEISVEIERGKSLVIRLLAIGDIDDDGNARLFFEFNGQPRAVSMPHRKSTAGKAGRRIADPADPGHVAAPMPGVVAAIAVKAGQPVRAGDVLMTLEAMKMETAISAPRDAVVEELVATTGQSVDAKDLLVVLNS